MFQHFIITRFNLRRDDWVTTKNDEKVLSDSWLAERFELFENYCFPSVKGQTDQNFKWLVFFDIDTPENYKQKIEQFSSSFKNFLPFFIDGMKMFLPSILKEVEKLNREEYIISSRLDNDDSLHKNYVHVVQSYFDHQKYLAIDIIDGYGVQTGPNVRLGKMRHLYNPYISLIEKKVNCQTVWHLGHTYWKYEKNFIRVRDKRLWLTVIHYKNKSNKFRGYGIVNKKILDEFNISSTKLNSLKMNYENYTLWFGQNIKNWYYNFSAYFSKEIKSTFGFYKIKQTFEKNKYD